MPSFTLAEQGRAAARRGEYLAGARCFEEASRAFDLAAPTCPEAYDDAGQLDTSWKRYWEGCASILRTLAGQD